MGEDEIKYSVADFERYHNGSMTPGEMHRLERAALNDPFLSDALDGYTYSVAPRQDIEDLEAQLEKSREKVKRPGLAMYGNMWLRIAATIILTAGIGWLSFKNYYKHTANTTVSLAQDKTAPSTTIASLAPAPGDQSGAADSMIIKSPPEDNSAIAKTEELPHTDQFFSPGAGKQKNSGAAPEPSEPEAISSAASEMPAGASEKKLLLKNKVPDDEGKPVAAAKPGRFSAMVVTNSDKDGMVSLPVQDSLVNTRDATVGYYTKLKPQKVGNAAPTAGQKSNNSVQEVVTTADGSAGKSVTANEDSESRADAVNTPLEGKVSGIKIMRDAQPSGGRINFDKYISDSLRRTVKGDSIQIGVVILSFKVSRDGGLKRIKVEQSLCQPCDAEAIRVLKAGPKWIYTGETRSATKIKF